jgi:hypothetical protein
MSSIFARLNYDSANTASSNLAPQTVVTLSRMPPVLNEWQTGDVANNEVSGYFTNPLADISHNIWNTANSIISITGLGQALPDVNTAAASLVSSAGNFWGHTNRISGVVQPNADTVFLPHYNTAVSVGKVVMQIVFQSDGVHNNAPIMGNFTSFTIGNTLTSMYSTIQGYPALIANTIIASGDEFGMTYTSNLSPNVANTMITNIQNAANLMNQRRTSDVNFYLNSQAIASNYHTIKQFGSPGQTELELYEKYVGSEKLLSRLNS